MRLGPTQIEGAYAEAFCMHYARLVITAGDAYWLEAAVRETAGYGTSIIGCDAEVGLERRLPADETPDGRPGASLLIFGVSADALGRAAASRTGQCVMTCPTTAAFDGLAEAPERIALGRRLRYFGDGFQKSKRLGGRRYWRIPVMDGEFLVEESLGVAQGVGGGNLILQARAQPAGLAAARRAVESVADMPGVITPFPGGAVRSGSKVGSCYRGLVASTSEAFCPTLRGRAASRLHEAANCAYEIVFDGVDRHTVGQAMAAAMRAAAGDGILVITAGNYGGKLGKIRLPLRDLL